MILVFEMTWTGTMHAPGNSATLQAIAAAFPEQTVRMHAEPGHIAELGRYPDLLACPNVEFRPIEVSPLFPGKTHIVSWRRFRHERATLRAGLRGAPRGEPCLVLLISATPTAIFAAGPLARAPGRRVGVQVGLHGNLNEIAGWRPRNPLTRSFDLRSALASPLLGHVRYLVLEAAIRDELARAAPRVAGRTDVLPHPINVSEMPPRGAGGFAPPLRIGFVGQGTAAKGFGTFLSLAREMTDRHGGAVSFQHVGRVLPGTSWEHLDVLADPATTEHLSRAEFIRRLAGLHYVLLPFQEGYYNLSASGALIDAMIWLKPVIATRLPLVEHFFRAHGEIGYLADDEAGLRRALEAVIVGMDAARYDRQVDAVAAVRESRTPRALAATYRAMIRDGFPGLLA